MPAMSWVQGTVQLCHDSYSFPRVEYLLSLYLIVVALSFFTQNHPSLVVSHHTVTVLLNMAVLPTLVVLASLPPASSSLACRGSGSSPPLSALTTPLYASTDKVSML
ncbi:hypothetical protein GUJ93_ZPchr0006g45587 [Zizania palustris]|uniref:Uncharacterized protein n=1 Tax=Zizania palustris TaxID=103762 RepID=A0A8J5T6K0_ZIZPA|nr:hypothetical protein GUJ93_ZPchr0006g45587 [Zizania palustris]